MISNEKEFQGKTQFWINFPLVWFLAVKLTGKKIGTEGEKRTRKVHFHSREN